MKDKKNILIIMIMVITLGLDQVTKYITSGYIKLNSSIPVIKNIFYISNVRNFGVAWSMLNNHRVLIIVINLIILVALTIYLKDFKKNTRNIIAFGLLYGGIIGNLIDRIIFGYVRDFIEVIIVNYHYPIFNIADSCVVIGIMLLIFAILRKEDRGNEARSR